MAVELVDLEHANGVATLAHDGILCRVVVVGDAVRGTVVHVIAICRIV